MGTTKLALTIVNQLLEILKFISLILISVLLSIIFLPILLFLWVLNQLARLLVSFLLWCEREGTTTLINSGVDGIWAYQKAGNSRNILIVYIYDSNINLEAFREKYMSQIVQCKAYEKLSKVLVKRYGYFCWKDTAAAADNTFDIRNHVKYATGSPRAMTEGGLKEFLSMLSEDMDCSRPQWEELIIPEFRYDHEPCFTRSARIYRSHHAYMDGGSTLIMSGSRMCTSHEEFPYMVNPIRRPKSSPAWKEVLFKVYCGLTFMTTVVQILYESSQIKSRFLLRKYSGKLRFGWSKAIRLCDLKEIKECARTTVPTVLSSIVGQSLVKLEADSQISNDEVAVGLVGAILPYPSIKPQNRFTVVNFNVPTNLRTTNLENLKKTQSKMNQLISSPNGYINYLLFNIFGSSPAFILQFMMDQACTPVIYSNTPWASERVKLWGDTVEDVIGWMPLLTTAGVGILTVSYCDSLRFCVIADESCLTVEEHNLLTEGFSTQVDELLEEARALRKDKDSCLGTLLV